MSIVAGSLAAGVGAGVKNTVLKASATVLPRKILVMGTALAALEDGISMAVPQLILSPEDGSAKYGRGSMLSRLIARAFAGSNYAVPIYAFPEAEASSGAVAAVGTLVLTASTPGVGSLYVYINSVLYQIPVLATSTPTTLGDALAAAINADLDAPVTAANVTGTITFTAKSAGPWGNGISISVNEWPQDGEALPTGVTATITAMATGAGLPTIATDLANGLGVGSAANADGFTDVIHGYMKETVALDALADYVGQGNEFSGLYDRNVHRPFRSLTGDVSTGSAGLAALIVITDARLNDRCNGVIARPGALAHPSEIAAVAIGEMAAANNELAESNYIGKVLPGVDPGNKAKLAGLDWTQQYTSRDIAVKAGISPTIIESGAVVMQNVVSFYRPASIPATSNAYRSMRNISILQNMLNAIYTVFNSEKWKQFTIVSNTANVSNSASRARARDVGDVRDELIALIKDFAANAWIYEAEYSLAALKVATAIAVRTGGDGFVNTIPFVLSGEGLIIDTTAYVDTSIAVLSA